MTFQKALELIETGLKRTEPNEWSDYCNAIRLFLPLMRAAAELEKSPPIPAIHASEKQEPPFP